MVPPRVAQKMSVVSVESMAFLAPGLKAAERAEPPASGRPGGVEATGASLPPKFYHEPISSCRHQVDSRFSGSARPCFWARLSFLGFY